MTSHRRTVEFAGRTLDRSRHICAFFNSADEERRVLRSFNKEGFDRGDKAVHIVETELQAEYLKGLADAGIDVQRVMDTGQLEVLPWSEAYVRDHTFDQDAMLASVETLIQSGAASGYPLTRLVGHHMDWVFRDKPAVNNFVEYEARLNHVLPKYNNAAICSYDLSTLSASVAMDIMRTHPMVIIGGLLDENPFYVPPDQFLDEMRQRRSARMTVAH
jgi:DcmR-like sensory protein